MLVSDGKKKIYLQPYYILLNPVRAYVKLLVCHSKIEIKRNGNDRVLSIPQRKQSRG